MKFKVYNKETHEDITNTQDWIMKPDGKLYYPEYDSFVCCENSAYYLFDTELMIAYPECGDWEALYIDGKLVDESHRIPSTRILQAVGETFKCNYGFMEIPDEIAELGMPEKLWELNELVGE
jgi:hypothetical protein